MAKEGRKAVPAVLAALHGKPSHDKEGAPVPDGVGAIWAPPAWFDDDQRAQWDYALEHAPFGLLTGTDRELLAIWCVASVEYARAVQQVRLLGQVVKTRDGAAIQSPFVGVMNKQAMMMMRAGAEMGFSPASRMALAMGVGGGGAGDPRYIGKGDHEDLQTYLAQKPDQLQ